jgi:5'-3' exonuclease|tara:strand:- start:5713 stop:6537 length:825 start_codon:yes stop_codon:yes gene_type:complete
MRALIDADILRYEIGFAAEAGWRAKTEDPEALPPFDYVREVLDLRLKHIVESTESDQATLFITEGPTFRDEIATVKPYKGTRPDNKPWHFDNLTMWMKEILGCNVITGIEADDAMAVEQLKSEDATIICSRDKDLRQVPGMFFSWELGRQPQFGPEEIIDPGTLSLAEDNKKLTGTGFAFFCAQVLMGDSVDNIPGLPGCGPKGTWEALEPVLNGSPNDDVRNHLIDTLIDMYDEKYGVGESEERLLEQGRLCWMTRRLNEDKTPELWEIGMSR